MNFSSDTTNQWRFSFPRTGRPSQKVSYSTHPQLQSKAFTETPRPPLKLAQNKPKPSSASSESSGMGNFYWRIVCSPLLRTSPHPNRRKTSHRRRFKRLPLPISVSISPHPKRRKTSQPADAHTEHQHPSTSPADVCQECDRDDRQDCEDPNYGYSCHQVFLSHSGYQKDFVEQLFVDLQRENISCFFDKDPHSLPKGEDFPPRIFKAAQECKVGVVVLSEEFISSKWPMLELSEFVKAQNSTNTKLKILPLFFRLSPQSLSQKLEDKDSLMCSWQGLFRGQKRTIDLDKWVDALKALRPINGLVYNNEQGSEVDYRAEIVRSIRRLLPRVLLYDESYIQGKERLCQKLERLFNNTPCGEDGVKMAGLYGVPGIGKTTLAKLACNFYYNDFDGRVLHVELGKEMAIERLKRALRILTNASEMQVNSITDVEQGWRLFNGLMMHGRRAFLAIDNISDLEDSNIEARRYLRAVRSARNESMILLLARSSTVLRRFIPERERLCMHLPSLTEEEAIPVLLELTPLKLSKLSSEEQDIAKKCALKCCFSWHCTGYKKKSFSAYHPLALRALGVFLYDSCTDLSRWIDIQNSSAPWRSGLENLFSIFEKSFDQLSDEYKNIFMLFCLYLPESHMISEEVFNWLALACDTKAEHIKVAIVELQRKGFVESIMQSDTQLYIHDLYIEFAENRADGTGKWISLKNSLGIPASLQEIDRPRLLAMKFDNCHFQCPSFVNDELFKNVLVLHLQDMRQLKIVNLSPMRIVRSITIVGCADMQEIRGLESLTSLVYFVVKGCSANVQFWGMEGLVALQHLQIDANLPETTSESSPLTWTLFPPLQSANVVGTISVDHIEKGTGRLDLGSCSKLQTIKLKNCRNWTEICLFSSTLKFRPLLTVGSAFSILRELTLEGLHNLKEIPTLTGLTALQTLELAEIHNLEELPTLSGLTALEELDLAGMYRLKELPTLTELTNLRHLELQGMHRLKELPTLAGLTALWNLRLEGMHSLKEFPTLTGLTGLLDFELEGMHRLKELPTLTGLTTPRRLLLKGMHSLKKFPTLPELTNLTFLSLTGMHSLKELPTTLTGLTKLRHLNLWGMHILKELPTLARFTALEWLWLEGMHSLKELPTLTELTNLRYLFLEGMHSLKELPALTGLTELHVLELEGMHNLKELPTFTGLTALHDLRLEGMHSLKKFPTLTGLTSLKKLELEGMHRLEDLSTLSRLSAVHELRVEGMHSLQELSTLTELTALHEFRLKEMHRLKELGTLTGLTFKIVTTVNSSADIHGNWRCIKSDDDSLTAVKGIRIVS